MKLRCYIPSRRRQAGITLIECLIFIVVFAILLGIATGTFCICWDGSRALVATTTDVSDALRVGELWRADVRKATGSISVENNPTGEVVKIPEGKAETLYIFSSGELQRQAGSETLPRVILPKVKSSEMKSDMRNGVMAWRWELELPERRKTPHFPMLFTFEAAQKTP
jgi:Tfp pilus assembly protein FimT